MNRARVLLCLAVSVSCSQESAGTTQTRAMALAVVGRVTTQEGAAIPGATIVVTPVYIDFSALNRPGDCIGNSGLPTTVQSANDGVFGLTLRSAVIPSRACVVARVAAPSGSGLLPAVDSATGVQFRSSDGNSKVDTARFAIVLRQSQ